jgi:hypothetical protein
MSFYVTRSPARLPRLKCSQERVPARARQDHPAGWVIKAHTEVRTKTIRPPRIGTFAEGCRQRAGRFCFLIGMRLNKILADRKMVADRVPMLRFGLTGERRLAALHQAMAM